MGVPLCLAFSGGTFLYTAVGHILPEVKAQYGGKGGGLGWEGMGALLLGLAAPALFDSGHHH